MKLSLAQQNDGSTAQLDESNWPYEEGGPRETKRSKSSANHHAYLYTERDFAGPATDFSQRNDLKVGKMPANVVIREMRIVHEGLVHTFPQTLCEITKTSTGALQKEIGSRARLKSKLMHTIIFPPR